MGFDPMSSTARELPLRSARHFASLTWVRISCVSDAESKQSTRSGGVGAIVQDQLLLLPLSLSGPVRHQSRIRLAADPPAVPATEPILLTSLYNGSPEVVKLCLYELAAALTSSLIGASLSSERRG